MAMSTTKILHAALLGGMLFALGACEDQPGGDPHDAVFADGAANHPIAVEPSTRSIEVAITDQGVAPADEAQFLGFVSDYLTDGNGVITISVPREFYSQSAAESIAGRLVSMGVPRSHILIGPREGSEYGRQIELSYLGYAAHTDACGDWSHDAARTVDNQPMPDFGCAVQHNIAAMVANPRDLVAPRPLGPIDASRRETIMKAYETGQITAAQKTEDQKGNVSDVATSGGGGQ
jgi:pilus assembly protein CpaD